MAPTDALQAAITATHAAIAHEPDPKDKAQLAKALHILMTVQADTMQDIQTGTDGWARNGQPGANQMAQPPLHQVLGQLLSQPGAGTGPVGAA